MSTSIDTAVIRGGWPKPHYGDAGEVIHRLCDALDEARAERAALLDVAEAAQAWAETLRPVADINTKEKASAFARRNFAAARDALLAALDLLPQGEPE